MSKQIGQKIRQTQVPNWSTGF